MSLREVDTREAGPFAVGLEQARGLVWLDAPAFEVGLQLDEGEITDDATLPAAEPLEADDADRPRSDASFALEPPRHRVGRELTQAFELERPADPHERGGPACVETERAQPRGRERGEGRGRRRNGQLGSLEPRARRIDDPMLEMPRATRLDQLTAERAEERVRHRRDPWWAQPAKLPGRRADQRVVREPAEKGGVVVVDGEREPKALDPLLALGVEHDAAVDELARGSELGSLADSEARRQRPVTDPSRGVACETGRERERVRPGRPDDVLDV